MHGRAGAHREIFPAVPAAVGLRLARGALLDVHRPARRAGDGALPALRYEPAFCRGVIREHPGQLNQREAVAVVFAGCAVRH